MSEVQAAYRLIIYLSCSYKSDWKCFT